MKLTSIDLYSNGKQVAAFSFRDPASSNPYIAQQVTGLDADEIVPKFNGTSFDGTTKHFDLAINKREIVILVALNPQWRLGKSYSDLRDDLYRTISASRDGMVQLIFKQGTLALGTIKGFVTKFETGLFSQTPQVQITIRCDDGMIRSVEEYIYDINELNDDVTEIGIGTVNRSVTLVDNKSTAPHGFRFNVTLTSVASFFDIIDTSSGDRFFKIEFDFLIDDVLYFSSVQNAKDVHVLRGVTETKLTDKVTIGSVWPVVYPGNNEFTFSSDGTFDWGELSYYNAYWGI